MNTLWSAPPGGSQTGGTCSHLSSWRMTALHCDEYTRGKCDCRDRCSKVVRSPSWSPAGRIGIGREAVREAQMSKRQGTGCAEPLRGPENAGAWDGGDLGVAGSQELGVCRG